MNTLAQLDTAPWPLLPDDQQAVVIGQVAPFARYCPTGCVLSIGPSRDPVTGPCATDWSHGDGLARVNLGFPLCVGCAVKLLTGPFGLFREGEHVTVEVLREAAP